MEIFLGPHRAIFTPTVISVISCVLIILILLLIIFIVLRLRRKSPPKTKKSQFAGSYSYATAGFKLPQRPPPPMLGSVPLLGNGQMLTNAQMMGNAPLLGSAQMRRATDSFPTYAQPQPQRPMLPSSSQMSSGRGSATEEDISRSSSRSVPMQQRSMPDSGLIADDQISLGSSDAPNAQEYLTSLGVVDCMARGGAEYGPRGGAEYASRGGASDVSQIISASAIEVFDQSHDSIEGVDLNSLLYAKLNEVGLDEGMDKNGSIPSYRAPSVPPGHRAPSVPPGHRAPSVPPISSPICNSAMSAPYDRSSWSRLPPEYAQPSFQPLTEVFSEIAKLKENGSLPRVPKGSRPANLPQIRNGTQTQETLMPQFYSPNDENPIGTSSLQRVNKGRRPAQRTESDVEIKI